VSAAADDEGQEDEGQEEVLSSRGVPHDNRCDRKHAWNGVYLAAVE